MANVSVRPCLRLAGRFLILALAIFITSVPTVLAAEHKCQLVKKLEFPITMTNLRPMMTAKINGELWSEGNSGSIFHSFEKMIAFASLEETLSPGDIIGSGTVGTGCGLELDRWVKPGDIIELEIEKIGVLKNKVVKA